MSNIYDAGRRELAYGCCRSERAPQTIEPKRSAQPMKIRGLFGKHHNSLPCKPSHNWYLLFVLVSYCVIFWCVLWLIIPPAVVYDQNIMSECTERQWCRMFKDGWINVHDEERKGWPSVVSDDLVQSVDQKNCERRCFTISECSCEFSHILRMVPCRIFTDRLGYRARWIEQ
jgi:hypothetical protein